MMELVPIQKRHQRACSFSPCTPKEEVMGTDSNMEAVCKPGRELSPKANHGGTLISSLQNMRKYISVVPAIQSMVFCHGSLS